MTPQISLFASAARPKFWQRLYSSLLKNTITFEICFVGPNPPSYDLPDNFHYKQSNTKPAQCYEAAARMCQGILIGWIADDFDYNHPAARSPQALDIIWKNYEMSLHDYNDNKTILSQITIEDYSKYGMSLDWNNHRLVHGDMTTPMMAPAGFMNRELYNQMGGFDKNFICGQHVNDMAMRVMQKGGRVIPVHQSTVYIQHSQCHDTYTFSSGLEHDRHFLESCWTRGQVILSTRSREFEPYDDLNILTENQGPAGDWSKVKVGAR